MVVEKRAGKGSFDHKWRQCDYKLGSKMTGPNLKWSPVDNYVGEWEDNVREGEQPQVRSGPASSAPRRTAPALLPTLRPKRMYLTTPPPPSLPANPFQNQKLSTVSIAE